MISSANIHAFDPAPRCQSGQIPLFLAMTLIYRVSVFLGRLTLNSCDCGFVSRSEISLMHLPAGWKLIPSFDTDTSRESGKNIHESTSWKKLPVTELTG